MNKAFFFKEQNNAIKKIKKYQQNQLGLQGKKKDGTSSIETKNLTH